MTNKSIILIEKIDEILKSEIRPKQNIRKPSKDLDLEAIHKFADEKKVTFHTEIHKDHWHLQWINREKDSEKGSGHEVLNKFHALADVKQKPITLQVFNNKPHLHDMYKRHGYLYSPKKTKNVKRNGLWMIRNPVKREL